MFKYTEAFGLQQMKILVPLVDGSLHKMLLTLMIAFRRLPSGRPSCAHWVEEHFLK